MKKKTLQVVSGLALAAGSLGVLGAFVIKKNRGRGGRRWSTKQPADVWARPGMNVTFRAELMPGRPRSERTFKVKELLPSGRVVLHDAGGEHAEREFEPVQVS
jgi:hypothetical protein